MHLIPFRQSCLYPFATEYLSVVIKWSLWHVHAWVTRHAIRMWGNNEWEQPTLIDSSNLAWGRHSVKSSTPQNWEFLPWGPHKIHTRTVPGILKFLAFVVCLSRLFTKALTTLSFCHAMTCMFVAMQLVQSEETLIPAHMITRLFCHKQFFGWL